MFVKSSSLECPRMLAQGQFTSLEFTPLLKDSGVTISMDAAPHPSADFTGT